MLRAARRKVQAALARLDQAQAARYPSFNLSGSIGLSALTVGALTGGGTVASSLLANVSVPLFDGGARPRRGACAKTRHSNKRA